MGKYNNNKNLIISIILMILVISILIIIILIISIILIILIILVVLIILAVSLDDVHVIYAALYTPDMATHGAPGLVPRPCCISCRQNI